ncbi:DNA-binding MarR family transcriptional regulator [Novosphingobium kunmingense]|uniref:DNA-binding MarR family transcriptional regulator n=1 Tax=Novosphingobium kunmingense TaxID=1211806 RepID=A0A2N0H5Y6_9SPHN|nr:helix-turn-helix domain-containing protein [Novosphingobium kunmingense]PKB14381.1 DNA-binding MarR family transcriptional regulator [Novosphingobium kunmingense]
MSDSHSAPIRLLDALVRLQGRLRGAFAEVQHGTGLSQMEHTVLAAVAEARSAPTVPQIGRSLGHPRQVIQRAANALRAKGLILVTDNPDHKRAQLLSATSAGAAIQAECNRRAEAIAKRLQEQTEPVRLEQAIVLVEAIRADLDAGARGDGA